LRLLRDGWKMGNTTSISRSHKVSTFEKRIGDGWILHKMAHATSDKLADGRGCYYDAHTIENLQSGETIDGDCWDWADIDHDRLVWTEAGKLFARQCKGGILGAVTELNDFNGMTFEKIVAPY
jgi:hypothetical protein